MPLLIPLVEPAWKLGAALCRGAVALGRAAVRASAAQRAMALLVVLEPGSAAAVGPLLLQMWLFLEGLSALQPRGPPPVSSWLHPAPLPSTLAPPLSSLPTLVRPPQPTPKG